MGNSDEESGRYYDLSNSILINNNTSTNGSGYVRASVVFFKQKTTYEMLRSLVGSEMCIRDRTQLVCVGNTVAVEVLLAYDELPLIYI